jgi:glucose/arabinose dehydrogenase
MKIPMLAALAALPLLAGCGETATLTDGADFGASPTLVQPRKSLIPTLNIARAVGWAEGQAPTAAQGLQVDALAMGLDHPRWLYVLPNGDVLVAESNAPPKPEGAGGIRGFVQGLMMKRAGAAVPSADRITLLRDADGDGVAETRSVFLSNLYSPFGMALVGDALYVANANGIVRFPYQAGQTRITAPAVKVIDLPAGLNHHWTKNVIASPDGAMLYATVGSNSNIGENGMETEVGRAAIWQINPATGQGRIFASGLRNPNGLAFEPVIGALWTAVNERDEIGSDLVPDYITSVRDGGFYGWPYSYYGKTLDERVQPQRPDLVSQAIRPDYAVGAHTAALGLAFATPQTLNPAFRSGAFIGQHGSWNRNPPSGYKVIYVPFSGGMPVGPPQDILTGFRDGDDARGRPVGVAVTARGDLLVADDVGNVVWRVSAPGAPAPAPEQVPPVAPPG